MLVIGNQTPSAELKTILTRWSQALPGAGMSTEDGLWLVVRRPADPGADQWTHKWKDPANLRTSRDQTFQPPFLPQWYDWPLFAGWWNSCVITGDGRMFFINAVRNASSHADLECRDIGSGMPLWQRPFSWDEPRDRSRLGIQPGRSMLVYAEEYLWLADDHRIIQLAAETGRELAVFEAFPSGQQIKWLCHDGDRLLCLAGDRDRYTIGVGQLATENPYGQALQALDPMSGTLLWEARAAGPVDERRIAVAEGRVYFQAGSEEVTCLDAATDDTLWTMRDPTVMDTLTAEPPQLNRDKITAQLNALRILTVENGALFFNHLKQAQAVALSAEDGRLL